MKYNFLHFHFISIVARSEDIEEIHQNVYDITLSRKKTKVMSNGI